MYKSIVMVKQVPDTANISGKVMNEDGTVNRNALPAIFNPEDKEALEFALRIKDQFGGKVVAVTMGPQRATDILKECLYMGADEVVLISDKKFAGSDTLATSYVLSEAIKQLGDFDFVFAGRQAIDGDTAQVGPQTAEKLNVPQITYAEEIVALKDKKVTIRKKTEGGYEILEAQLPVLVTVLKDAVEPRPFSAKHLMAKKKAKSLIDLEKINDGYSGITVEDLVEKYTAKNLFIKTLTMNELQLDESRLGLRGSPTKVHKIESVVLGAGDTMKIEPNKDGLSKLIDHLMEDHILG